MLDFKLTDIRLAAEAQSSEEAIAQAGALLVKNGYIDPQYASSMQDRERLSSTYLGSGIAIPHGLPGDRRLIRATGIVVMQFPSGVLWDKDDYSRLVIGIAARGNEHLDILARLTEILQKSALLKRFTNPREAQEIVEMLTGNVA